MRIRNVLIAAGLIAVLAVGLLAGRALEKKGNPDSPSGPAATSSYTLEDIYNRLDTGAPGTPGTFTEPTSGPGTGTMHTLNEIMGLAGTACTQCNPPAELSPLARWCDNNNGTVTDMTTGLVWLKKADWGGTKTWRCLDSDVDPYDDAHTRAGLLKAGTADANLSDGSVEGDWRLPTKTELLGLANGTEAVRSGTTPCAFTGVQSAHYWSSTTYAGYTDYAWVVDLHYGFVYDFVSKVSYYYVWPVRAGQ